MNATENLIALLLSLKFVRNESYNQVPEMNVYDRDLLNGRRVRVAFTDDITVYAFDKYGVQTSRAMLNIEMDPEILLALIKSTIKVNSARR